MEMQFKHHIFLLIHRESMDNRFTHFMGFHVFRSPKYINHTSRGWSVCAFPYVYTFAASITQTQIIAETANLEFVLNINDARYF